MNLYLDMEFTGLHQHTTPIAIGIVADNGAKFYSEFTDYNRRQVDRWIQENVIDNLIYQNVNWDQFFDGIDLSKQDRPYVNSKYTDGFFSIKSAGRIEQVVQDLKEWLSQFVVEGINIVGDVLAWDWILFCELLGGTFEIQEYGIFYIPFDISTILTNPDIIREELIGQDRAMHVAELSSNFLALSSKSFVGKKHNALWDALVIKEIYNMWANDHVDSHQGQFIGRD